MLAFVGKKVGHQRGTFIGKHSTFHYRSLMKGGLAKSVVASLGVGTAIHNAAYLTPS